MAAINDLIAQIQDAELRNKIENACELRKQCYIKIWKYQ